MQSKPLGQQIEDFRLNREMTIRQVAAFLGVSVGTVVRLTRGEKCTKLTKVKIERQLAKAQVAA